MRPDYVRLERTMHYEWMQLPPEHLDDFLRLARLHGWTGQAWCDRDDPCTLTAAEAVELAEALERSLGDTSDHDAGTPKRIPEVGATAEQGAADGVAARRRPPRPPPPPDPGRLPYFTSAAGGMAC
jgi:hypothetical protein